jgi:hypothetical protein
MSSVLSLRSNVKDYEVSERPIDVHLINFDNKDRQDGGRDSKEVESDIPSEVQRQFYELFNKAKQYSQQAQEKLSGEQKGGQTSRSKSKSKSSSKSNFRERLSKLAKLPTQLAVAQMLAQDARASGVQDKYGLAYIDLVSVMNAIVRKAIEDVGNKTDVDAIYQKSKEIYDNDLDQYIQAKKQLLQSNIMNEGPKVTQQEARSVYQRRRYSKEH